MRLSRHVKCSTFHLCLALLCIPNDLQAWRRVGSNDAICSANHSTLSYTELTLKALSRTWQDRKRPTNLSALGKLCKNWRLSSADGRISLEAVTSGAIINHIKLVTAGDARCNVLSLPSTAAADTMRRLDDILESQARPSRPQSSQIVLQSDVHKGADTLRTASPQHVFFCVLKSDAAKWKAVHVSSVASGRIPPHAMLISKHRMLTDDCENPIVSDRPQDASAPACVFTGLSSLPIETLQRDFLQWVTEMETQCCLRDISVLDSDSDQLASVVTRVWRQLFSSDETRRFVPAIGWETEVVNDLSTSGYVEHDDEIGGFVLTGAGIDNVELGSCLQNPKPVLERRPTWRSKTCPAMNSSWRWPMMVGVGVAFRDRSPHVRL